MLWSPTGPLNGATSSFQTRTFKCSADEVRDPERKCFQRQQFVLPQNWPRPLRSSSQPWVESLYPLIRGCVLLHTHKYTEWICAPTGAPIKQEDILCVHISRAHLTLELPVFKLQRMREKSCDGTPLLV